ncbi:hypothetical protein GCM10023235_11040 [Kitasatospora terrestris]|uniref:Uncharacterized protein n=1 Tax=Kitasatospora terrestris TaxID=258051 RepID=A0ABP9DHY0_9ACTN
MVTECKTGPGGAGGGQSMVCGVSCEVGDPRGGRPEGAGPLLVAVRGARIGSAPGCLRLGGDPWLRSSAPPPPRAAPGGGAGGQEGAVQKAQKVQKVRFQASILPVSWVAMSRTLSFQVPLAASEEALTV